MNPTQSVSKKESQWANKLLKFLSKMEADGIKLNINSTLALSEIALPTPTPSVNRKTRRAKTKKTK